MRRRHVPAHLKRRIRRTVFLPSNRVVWSMVLIYVSATILVNYSAAQLIVPMLFASMAICLLVGAGATYCLGFIFFHIKRNEFFIDVMYNIAIYSLCLLQCFEKQDDVLIQCKLKHCESSDIRNLNASVSACRSLLPLVMMLCINCFATLICLRIDKNEKSFPRKYLAGYLLFPLPVLFVVYTIDMFFGLIGELYSTITSLNEPVFLLMGMLGVNYSCKLIGYQMPRKSDYIERQFGL